MYDKIQFTPNGVAGIFALYTQPGANLRDAFMNEFFVVRFTPTDNIRLITCLMAGFLFGVSFFQESLSNAQHTSSLL